MNKKRSLASVEAEMAQVGAQKGLVVEGLLRGEDRGLGVVELCDGWLFRDENSDWEARTDYVDGGWRSALEVSFSRTRHDFTVAEVRKGADFVARVEAWLAEAAPALARLWALRAKYAELEDEDVADEAEAAE